MIRPDERRLVAPAAVVAALGGAGGALAASGADALFLAHVGAEHLGLALAASSLLVALVLAVVGGIADRVDRRRLLGGSAATAAAGAALLAALAGAAPAWAGVVGLVVVKQLQAAVDLSFWVVVAERLDARRARRLVPRLAAAQGLGVAAGALAVIPLATLGVGTVLAAAAICYAGAAAAAARLEVGRRVAAPVRARPASGLATLRRSPLAVELAVVVGIAGAFGALAFYTLGAAAAAEVGGERELAQLLGTIRGAVQLATLVAQVAIAPRLLDRAGVGVALVIAPAAAVGFSAGYELSGALAAAIAVQAHARLLDAAVQTPAEKVALGLVPRELRGRVGGFLDGTAKRAGSIAGGLGAMALAGWPRALGGAMLAVAAIWLVAAWRLRRRLPALAVAALAAPRAQADEVDALADPRAVALVEAELGGAGAARAAEILARLHARGRVDAIPRLAAALPSAPAPARGVVAGAIAACAEVGPRRHPEVAAALAAWAREHAGDPAAEPVVRAAGLLGAGDLALDELGLAGRVATARAQGAPVGDLLDEAIEDGDPAARATAVREARAELLGAAGDAFEAARRLVRAIRRVRGGDDAVAAGLDALASLVARVSAERRAEWILLRGDLVELARRAADRRPDPGRALAPPAVAAAALRLLGELCEIDAGGADDLRLLVHALGDRDDDVRDAAEDALRGLGARATGELALAAAYGRRGGRDRALALLRDLPVTEAALDRMIAVELDLLDRTLVHLGALADLSPVVARRLEERAREIGLTILLLVAARHRGAALPAAARLWRHAPDGETRARAVEIVDAALPRAIAVRVTGALDEGPPVVRAHQAADRLGLDLDDPGLRDAAIRAELAGGDRLARGLVVHALGADGRARFRDAIASAAHDAARDLSPLALLRRITGTEDGEREDDVPTQVETLLLLGNVPLLAGLTTRQLAELAEAVRWQDLAPGEVAVAAGEVVDALIVVAHGALRVDDTSPRTIGPGQTLDDLAVVAPAPAPAAVVATEPTRLLRVTRVDFEELVDDVPGLGAAVCRILGSRARR